MSITRRTFLTVTAGASVAPSALAESSQTEKTIPIRDHGWKRRQLKRKPNVVMIVLDDVGFSDLACYGSELQTPAMDALANDGVRFNNFHVTALCAPTRACLLTGRNAHAVGVGNIAEWGRADHPGYHGWIRQDAMTLPEILKAHGYSTYATGKWHLSPLDEQNANGPFDQWPTQRGFDRWYGFHGNAMDHWHPEMFENTSPAYPDKSGHYHLSEDLADRSIHYIADHLSGSSDRPFFLYFALGALHFPLHAPQADIDKQRGRYDIGWDAFRQQRFDRQRQLGIVPPDTQLPTNPDVPDWESLSDKERKLAARSQEVYAAFLEHTDQQIERLLNFLRSEQQLDDTIVMLVSDNGAAPGGPVYGSVDVRRDAYLGRPTIDESLESLEALGSDASYCGAARGWSQVSNTPLKWYKSDTHEGGIRSPLIVSWPNGKLPTRSINTQYHHAIDVVPTILNLINEEMPGLAGDTAPLPLQGKSFAYSFDNPSAPTPKQVQYYETLGDRAIWADGWKAVARHTTGDDYGDDVWELYHAAEDFSEVRNLADSEPEKLNRMITLWREEAERYNVLPLADNALALYQNAVPAPRATYVFYPGMTRLERLTAPDIFHFTTRFNAEIKVDETAANGVILAAGDSSGGYEWFLMDGRVHFGYVYTRNEVYHVATSQRVKSGSQTLGLHIIKTGDTSAIAKLFINDAQAAELTLKKMWPIYAPNSGIRCGENRHAPITRRYAPPFQLNQHLERVIVDVDVTQA